MRMDGYDRNELRCLPTPVDCSRHSLLSTNTSLVKREGTAKSRTLCATPRAISHGTVVVYFSRLGGPMFTHEKVTLSVVAEAIAKIKGLRVATTKPRVIREMYSSFQTIP